MSDKNTGLKSPKIGGKTVEILQRLIKDGYYISKGTVWSNLKTLRLYFPVKKVSIQNHVIYFLKGYEKVVFRELLKLLKKKKFTPQELSYIAKAFGINLRNRGRRSIREFLSLQN